MGIDTTIGWCDSTVNGMMGCDGCELYNPAQNINKCYASVLTGRHAGQVGWPQSFDIPTLFPDRLKKALKWPDLTGKDRPDKPWLNGYPRVIFHGDLGDYWTESLPLNWLEPYVAELADSPHIHLFLTKRPNRMFQFWQSLNIEMPKNFWFLTTVTTQEKCWRLKHLAEMHHLGASVLGISYEPAMGFVDFEYPKDSYPDGPPMCCSGQDCGCMGLPVDPPVIYDFDWLIVGGESGQNASPFEVEWARKSIDACREWNIPCFFKQMGSVPLIREYTMEEYRARQIPELEWPDGTFFGNRTGNPKLNGRQVLLTDKKGEDWTQWPVDLRVREMPKI
jgi:protein gp37